jgi:transcription antitermination factor NusG
MTVVGHYVGQVVDPVDVTKRREVKVAMHDMVWHLVQVSDNIASSDVEFLRYHGIEFYQPMIRNFKPVARNTLSRAQRRSNIRPAKEKIEPFFPGYAFVDFTEAGERWREMFLIARIRGLAIANGRPLRVEWKEIQKIKVREVDGAVPGTIHLSEIGFKPGETVRIEDGSVWSGFPATIEAFPDLPLDATGSPRLEQLDDSMRVQLLVNLFGRENRIEVTVGDLDKL